MGARDKANQTKNLDLISMTLLRSRETFLGKRTRGGGLKQGVMQRYDGWGSPVIVGLTWEALHTTVFSHRNYFYSLYKITPRSKAGKILIRTGPKRSFCKNLLLSNMKEGGGERILHGINPDRFSHTISINGPMGFDLLSTQQRSFESKTPSKANAVGERI